MKNILAPGTPDLAFAVGDQVMVDGDPDDRWRITQIVTDHPRHDGPFALLHNEAGERSWSALRILQHLCPTGCAGHLDGPVHISVEQRITATAGPERHEIYVSRELDSRPGAVPAVRIQGAGDAPMQPEQALQFAFAVVAEAFAAMAWQVTQ